MTTTESLEQLMNQQAELSPSLQGYLMHDKVLGKVLKHPLVFAIPYTSQLNALYNKQYEQKALALENAKKDEDWGSYVFLHERPYRINAFIQVFTQLTDQQYGEILGEIITDTENFFQWKPVLSRLLSRKGWAGDGSWKTFLMSEEERKTLKTLPLVITVFRGCKDHNKNGWSWTLNVETAQFFSKRYGSKEGFVLTGTVKKEKVIAYFNGRNEMEILADPRHVQNKRKLETLSGIGKI